MPFTRYHLVIFKDKASGSKNIRLRAWVLVLLTIIFFALIAININLWQYYQKSRTLETRLLSSERQSQIQSVELKTMVTELEKMRTELGRVQEFDIKLKSMMSLNEEADVLSELTAASSLRGLPIYRQELAARKMRNFIKDLSEEIKLEEISQQRLLIALRNNYNDLAIVPSIMPTVGIVTSPFSNRTSPITGKKEFHKGVDISNKQNTPIIATARGVVSFAGDDGAYGVSVEVSHGNDIMTKYAHMSRFIVQDKQQVERGEVIGFMGRTGRATGNHVHYEVRIKGVPVNPQRYILN